MGYTDTLIFHSLKTQMLQKQRLATDSAPAAIQDCSRGRPHNGPVQKNNPLATNVHVRPCLQPTVPLEGPPYETDGDARRFV